MKVGICIPNYNMGKYLKFAIKSAINQTHLKCTLYILDNASNDDSWSIIQDYNKKYKNIKIYRNEYTLSMEENWTKVLRLAKDEDFVNILSSDDILHPTYISECLSLYEKFDNELGYVYSERRNIKEGKVIDSFDFYESSAVIPFPSEFVMNVKGFHTAPCQLLINNIALKDVKYLSTEFGIVSDMHMTLKINAKYDVGYIKKKLVDYNISSGMSANSDISKQMAILFYRLKKDILNNYLPSSLYDKKESLELDLKFFCSKFCLSKCLILLNDDRFTEVKELFLLATTFDESLIHTKLFKTILNDTKYDKIFLSESIKKMYNEQKGNSYALPKNAKILEDY